jgi:gliding motility-associated-like protein
MRTLPKIVFLMLVVFSENPGLAQPSNPTNYCSWMYNMLGPGNYFKNDTAKVCSGYTIGGGFSNTLPNTTYRLDNGFITYTSDSLGRIHLPPITSEGQHWFDITKDGCTASDSMFVLYVTRPVVHLGNDTTLCVGDSLVLDAGNPGASYVWNGNYNNANQEQTFVVRDVGKYRVIVTVPGCSSMDTIEVSYKVPSNFSLGPDQLICEGESVLLSPGNVNAKYLWQDGSTKPVFTVSGPGTYSVRMVEACGTFYDTIIFRSSLCKLYVPNAFTPNSDGKNDVFKVAGYDNLSSFHFRIYNRWGAQVFFSSLPENGWNGFLNGQPQPQGVYVWILEYKKKYNQESFLQKGTVTLIR